MYTLIYHVRETKVGMNFESKEVIEREYKGEQLRLRRTALNFLREIVRETYIDKGYATEDIKSGINCYKSEKTDKGERKMTEIQIKVEKI